MRGLLFGASAFVLIAGLPLYVLSTDTATWFAWTIDPPLTAATLGGCYWAACLLELLAARSRSWVGARVAVPGVLVFTALTNIPTLQNVDSFHLGGLQAWVWIATYLAVPPLFLWALSLQRRVPGDDPPRAVPLQPPLHFALAALGALLLGGGFALLVAPSATGAFWPWVLNPPNSTYKTFTEPYLGVWGLGLGVVAAQGAWEADHERLRPVFPSMLLLGLLQAGAVYRFGSVLDPSRPATVAYLALIAGIVGIGAAGLALRPRPS